MDEDDDVPVLNKRSSSFVLHQYRRSFSTASTRTVSLEQYRTRKRSFVDVVVKHMISLGLLPRWRAESGFRLQHLPHSLKIDLCLKNKKRDRDLPAWEGTLTVQVCLCMRRERPRLRVMNKPSGMGLVRRVVSVGRRRRETHGQTVRGLVEVRGRRSFGFVLRRR